MLSERDNGGSRGECVASDLDPIPMTDGLVLADAPWFDGREDGLPELGCKVGWQRWQPRITTG